jgi:hypothetical protein
VISCRLLPFFSKNTKNILYSVKHQFLFFSEMKYCLTGNATDRVVRRKNETGVKLCVPTGLNYCVGWGEIEDIRLNIKIRLLPGYFALISVNPEYAAKGLTILNNVIAKNSDEPLILHVTCLSAKADIEILSLQNFADLHVMEEGDRTTPYKLEKAEWDKDTELMKSREKQVEIIDCTLDPSDSVESGELTDFDIEEIENKHCSQAKKSKNSHILSEVEEVDADEGQSA